MELPELARSKVDIAEEPDVEFKIGEVPGILETPTAEGLFFQASPTECLLVAPDGNRYYLRQGRQIVLAPAAVGSDAMARYFLVYGALPLLLVQRGFFLLHGSAVSNGQQALLFLGTSLSGKSTLAAGFVQRGWKLLCDEVVVCRIDSAQGVSIEPGVPQVLIWQHAVAQLKLDINHLQPSRTPGQFIFNVGERFESRAIPVRSVYTLKRTSDNEPQPTPQGLAKFKLIPEYLYQPRLPRPASIDVEQAQIPLRLPSLPFKTLVWPPRKCSVHDFLDRIQEAVS